MEKLVKLIQERFDEMCATGKLFRCNIEGDLLWDAYIGGFVNDPIFRSTESSVHNCNYCKSFIRRYGNIVALDKDLNLMTLFDIDAPEEFKPSIDSMSALIKNQGKIRDVFTETYSFLADPKTPYENKVNKSQSSFKLGVEKNVKRYLQEDVDMWPNSGIVVNQIITFNHLYITIPRQFIDFSGRSIGDICSGPRQIKDVFKRGLEEISLDTLILVKDLESQGSLLNGESYKHIVLKAIDCAKEYATIPTEKRDAWLWLKSLEMGPSAAFRNTAIGTLMVDLAEGKEINEACKAFNYKVDPANYMKATAPITKKQIEEAEKFVEENGYEESFTRRCATLEDIKVCDILHANQDADKVKTKVSVFDGVKASQSTRHKKSEFKNVEEVSIEKFMTDILPGCTQVELYLGNRLAKNFVTLLTSENKESKPIFKWDNNFSWTYTGNLAGASQIKQAVKNAGGYVDAPFRFSIMWNEDGRSIVDFDAHMTEPDRHEIYYASNNIGKNMSLINNMKSKCGGVLDIDMISPSGVGVENIFYSDLKDLKNGIYRAYVHNFNNGRNTGIKAEIFFQGQVWQFAVPHEITRSSNVEFARLTIKNGELVSIEVNEQYLTNSEEHSENIYGLDTCEFHKVNLVCLSPNYWQEHGVGNKHYFFMLEGAQSPEEIRTFHNEFLTNDLLQHRKVMEVLGAKLRCKSTKKQLSGCGFNATVRDEVILRLGGSHKRVIKVKF